MGVPSNENKRRLLITGATGGMGRACTLLAAEQGYQLLLADLSVSKLEQLAAECSGQQGAVACHVLDVTDAVSIEALAGALQAGGGIDAIIHSVGISPQMGSWEQIIEVDLIGTTRFVEAARPALKPGGCALCVSSMSAYMGPPDAAIELALSRPLAPGLMAQLQAMSSPLLAHPGLAYAFAKKALKNYVADQAAAWGKEGKRIVSLSPGLIDTEMGRLENDAMENFEAMRRQIALGRLGEPEDIANTALFLVSPEAGYITGCDILVDGGFVASFNKQQRQSSS